MTQTLVMGAVAYAPKVVTIWEGFKAYFIERGYYFDYVLYSNYESLTEAFTRLHARQIIPAIADGLAATVYTQLSDVEDEVNGLVTYDRRLCKMDPARMRKINSKLRF